MPRYSYECTKCAHVYEKVEGWDAKARQRCPKCRAVSQRILVAPAIVFKGSGFYATDNRKSGYRGGKDEGDGDGKSDSKGDADGGSDATGDGGSDAAASSDNGSGDSGAKSDKKTAGKSSAKSPKK